MSETRITVAHSPDSDDAFMFFGLAHGAVETHGIVVDQVLADIETLNRAAFEGRYEVTAVSFHAFAHLGDKYALLPHGASMGDRYGPLVVGRQGGPRKVRGTRVAIPGTLTTAYLTLRLYEPDFEYVVVPFDQIQQAVLEGKADTGLLIHEGQLTYAEEGLQKVVDLGEWWADHTGGLPLPLGGNIIRRDLGPEMITKVSKMLHDSIAYALSHREQAVEYAIQFGRGLDRERTDTFVGMYVNNLTLSYGERGRMAVERLLGEAYEKGPDSAAGADRIRGVIFRPGPGGSLPAEAGSHASSKGRRPSLEFVASGFSRKAAAVSSPAAPPQSTRFPRQPAGPGPPSAGRRGCDTARRTAGTDASELHVRSSFPSLHDPSVRRAARESLRVRGR